MGLWSSVAGLMLVVAAAGIALEGSVASAATNHVVGGSTGWKIPPSATTYSDWAATQSFAVGDTLEFQFMTGQHEVVQVPKSGYDSCSGSNQIGSTLSTSPASVTLNATGDYYFICFPGHCASGQKLAVSIGSSPSGASPAPAVGGPTPPTPASGSGTTPPTPASGSGTTPSTPASGGGGSSAAAALPSGFRTAVGFSLGAAVVSVAASLLF